MVLSDSIKYTIMMKNFIMIVCEKSLLQYGHVIYNEVQVIWIVYSLMEHHKEDESSQASWTLSNIEHPGPYNGGVWGGSTEPPFL